MRTTVDVPDDLYRRVKAEAALQGRKFKDLVEEALRRWLASEPAEGEKSEHSRSFHDLMRDCCGIVAHAPPDLATNPAHMEGFGR